MVEFKSGAWSTGPVLVAETFWERFRGLIGRPAGTAMLIRGRSVHGIGLHGPCLVVALDRHAVVLSTTLLLPNRVLGVRRAHSMLELPAMHAPPNTGVRLEVAVWTQNSGYSARSD